ncbi:sn-glycerol-3-phosphate ABC transporter ATP-binding protein UgpC [bacterium]|nr:sn-glycerol-3-phosphate ABC transporter ATP-binding protein UgpC [bacterium]
MATVELNDVKKSFGKTEVIKGISACIEDGEFIVIVGPSGCGKSTLLRMVAGLESASSGDIAIKGIRVNEKEPMDRDIAMVFQNYALYPHMSVRKNMAYSLKIAKVPNSVIDRKVNEAATLLQLEEYLDRKPRELSGGQRQRVAMGRAIVREPAVFLFDEPLSNLDAKLRVQMRMEIKQLQAKLGVTSLYVTHDQVEAMTMADRMIVMNAGIAEQIGSPLEVYETPQSLFAAQFIGSPAMNILDGTVSDGKITLENGVVLPSESSHRGEVKIGIRPEHMIADSSGPIELDVSFTEPLGATTSFHGQLVGGSSRLTTSLPGVHHMQQRSIKLAVEPGNIHVFDTVTGVRLS